MTHRLLVDYYTAHEKHISCFLVPLFSFVILLSVLDVFSFITGVPVMLTKLRLHKRFGSIINNNEIWGNKKGLLKLNSHVL